MNDFRNAKTFALGILGAIGGGIVGYFAFVWIYQQGFSALVVPGWLLGIGAGLCARQRHVPLAVTCAVLSLALGIFSEWRVSPFTHDTSFAYFIAHLHNLQPITLIMIALGVYLGYNGALTRQHR